MPDNQAILGAMPLARMMALKIARHHKLESFEPEDCVGEAYLALCQAADIYDPNKGTFNTIAGRKAAWQVKEALRSNDSFIKTTRLMQKNNETPVVVSVEESPWKSASGDDDAPAYTDIFKDEKQEKAFADEIEKEAWGEILSRLPHPERVILQAIMNDETMLQLADKDPFNRSHGHLLNERGRVLKKIRKMMEG